ncbi:hypothetical protein [Chitinibacter sp. ZOR0017]|uniref:hypothetical protein n=1 Tax=Chitinibacter sp. ZOR0017 TaxID=1339254 RepID=UPI0006466342|nr:hypothetical protein [Chitinibacter sp. ZOR0017]
MQDENLFSDFFQPGFVPHELPQVAELLRARTYIDALIALFRGGEDEVFVRLIVLREIGARADAPRWSPQDLQAHFAYINQVKLDTVLKRLRDYGLLVWDSDEQMYGMAEAGRVALSSLGTMLQFAEGDAELGYLTSQVAAGQSLGQVSNEVLLNLLARLNELYADFEAALESQSEFQIRAAREKLEKVWQWVEKGTDVIRAVLTDETTDQRVYQVAQSIALAQARMLRLTSVFHRRLSELASQRVHLGQSGLSTTNVADWLRRQTQASLAELGRDLILYHPEPHFVVSDILLDIAEFEICERERPDNSVSDMPQSAAAQEVGAVEAERLLAAEALYDELNQLAQLGAGSDLPDAVLAPTYNETAYRLSLLSLLGDAEAALEKSVVADIVKLPLRLEAQTELYEPDHPEVASISAGRLHPL